MTTLHVDSLKKAYKKRTVVREVSLSVSQGEIIGLLGPNGAGKTTSFYMIIGLVKSDAGTVRLDNNDLTSLPMHERARQGIGYLPQEASIFRKLSVTDNILAILQTRKDLNNKQRTIKLQSLLAEFNIEHIADNTGMSLSGGERRRVEIARALATEPMFMLLDEPFAGVDPISVNDIKQIILDLSKRNIGVLITDHNVRETLDICQRSYIVNEGAILAQGDRDSILQNQTVKDVYLGEKFQA